MEIEVRFYYSSSELDKILNYLKSFDELNYIGKFYEETKQYNHPMKELDFYSKEIDGRFRVRRTIGDFSKCMITWKRRLNNNNLIHREEEIEVNINTDEYDNLINLLENIIHLQLVESYERYRYIFKNDDIEIVVDLYPFGIAIELENKSSNKDPDAILKKWLNKLKLNLEDAYKLSWDDKYSELCNEQNKTVEKIVIFDKEMPQVKNKFIL